MQWLRSHPYAATSALIGLILIAGAIFIESRLGIAPGELSVWGSNGAPLLNPTSYAPIKPVAQNTEPQTSVTSDAPPAYIPPSQNTDAGVQATDEMDFEIFLQSLITPSKTPPAATSSDTGIAYSFIPQGLISVNVPQKSRTPEQQKLFDYGNDAGSYIQTYEDSNRNAPVALRDQAEDRQNPAKIQAVKLVASGLRTVGESLLGMENVPESVATQHKALAESYVDVGRKLAQIPDVIQSDAAFITSIEAYNAAADTWVKNYISLATIFSVSGVTFTEIDPGSVFTFSRGGSL